MTSIIMDDIRKRSIRIQRDQILERIKQEEEFQNLSLPKQLIIEAEERARERIDGQSWKKYFIMVLIMTGIGYIIFKFTRNNVPVSPPPQHSSEKKTVKFNPEMTIREISTARLRKEYPDAWKGFKNKESPTWLVSNLSGKLSFEYFNPELGVAIDVVMREDLSFPSKKYKDDEIKFENFIYDIELKKTECKARNIQYLSWVVDNNYKFEESDTEEEDEVVLGNKLLS